MVYADVIASTLILIDGFDVAVMAYAAPSLSRAGGLDPSPCASCPSLSTTC